MFILFILSLQEQFVFTAIVAQNPQHSTFYLGSLLRPSVDVGGGNIEGVAGGADVFPPGVMESMKLLAAV